MMMKDFSVTLSNYSVGESAYRQIGKYCSPYGRRAVIIGGKTAVEKAAPKILENCGPIGVSAKIWYGGECSYENADVLADMREVKDADMIFALGGGKAIDTCKCLADRLAKPVFTFPTVASSPACCSCISFMHTHDGIFAEPYFSENSPVHVFIDTEIICNAPEKYLRSGMGWAYSWFYETQISERGGKPGRFRSINLPFSQMCAEVIFECGVKAYRDNKKRIDSEEFRNTVLAVTVLAGLPCAMLANDSSLFSFGGLSGAVVRLLNYVKGRTDRQDGELAAFGALLCLLYDGQVDEYTQLKRFNEKIGLPVITRDLGLAIEDMDDLADDLCGLSKGNSYPYAIEPERLKNIFRLL